MKFLIVKVLIALLIICAALLLFGRATNNITLMLIGGVPALIGCIIALIVTLIDLWKI